MFLFIFVEMKPAFFAILGSTGSIGNSEILKFNVVKTNTGSGYDAITGVFVVPKRGTYHFTSVVYTHLADDAVVQMNKNTALVVRGYSTGTTHATSNSQYDLWCLHATQYSDFDPGSENVHCFKSILQKHINLNLIN
jgi:hypothetical protein